MLPDCRALNNSSLGPRFGIQRWYRDVDMPRPRKRAARIRNPSLRGSIGENTDFVFSITLPPHPVPLPIRPVLRSSTAEGGWGEGGRRPGEGSFGFFFANLFWQPF